MQQCVRHDLQGIYLYRPKNLHLAQYLFVEFERTRADMYR